MNRKGKRAMAVLIDLSLLMGGLPACRNTPPADPAVISGGTTTHQDPDAPKVIESKELTEFSASMVLDNRWRGDEERSFAFSVEPDEQGILTASEGHTGISRPADKDLLDALAEVIAQNNLAAQNGLYDVTAGLPYEFEPFPFRAVYASGEELNFTVNNNPAAAWAEEVYDVFAGWFAMHGIDALEPARDGTPLTRFIMQVTEGTRTVWYTDITVSEEEAVDGETYVFGRLILNNGNVDRDEGRYCRITKELYEGIRSVIDATDLEKNYNFSFYNRQTGSMDNHDLGYYGMGPLTTADDEPDAENRALSLYMEFESGFSMNIETKKASEIEGMRSLIDALEAYLDPLFG